MPDLTTCAIVTGAARPWGLGRAAAFALARRGFNLVIADVRDDWGAEAATEIAAKTGRRAIYVHTDVSNRASVAALVARAMQEYERIDVLANIAGITARVTIEQMEEAAFDRLIAVNLKGTFLTCQAVIPIMRNQGGGHIVNTASGGAFQPLKRIGVYSATKAGIVAFSKVLAWEVASDNIIVTTVAPGRVPTAMGDDNAPTEDIAEMAARGQPFRRANTPEEVAEVIAYAAMLESPILTGQTLHANGGAYMV